MLIGYGTSGTSHDFFAFNNANQVWSGAAFVTWVDANYLTYRIAATETGTSGRFTGSHPRGTTSYELRVRSGSLAGSTVAFQQILSLTTDAAEEVVITPSANPDQVPGYTIVRDADGTPLAGIKLNYFLFDPSPDDDDGVPGSAWSRRVKSDVTSAVTTGLWQKNFARGKKYGIRYNTGELVYFTAPTDPLVTSFEIDEIASDIG